MKKKFLQSVFLMYASLGLVILAGPSGAKTAEQQPTASTNDAHLKDQKATNMTDKVIKSEEEWRKILTPEQFKITRKAGTERAFTGKYHDFKGKGIYQCICCGNHLFSSEAKFDSGTGWPSFWEPISEQNIKTAIDTSFFMKRIEVKCNRCDAHLGHLFNDGPPPTGLRYCINSVALKFVHNEDNPAK